MASTNFTLLFDSNSTLYDSLDLTSYKRRKKQSRLIRTLQKLLRLVFGSKQREAAVRLELAQRCVRGSTDEIELYGCAYPVRWSGGGLESIPELSEKGVESPELEYSVVRRAVSERFTSSTSGVLVRIPAG